jgi:hypothetical protein
VQVLLPVHTDPSLISLIVHDVPGVRPGALGLEYLRPRRQRGAGAGGSVAGRRSSSGGVSDEVSGGTEPTAEPTGDRCAEPTGDRGAESTGDRGAEGEWLVVASHGHGVVTVLVGAVLDRITGGLYPAAKHRVASTNPSGLGRRVAATFFFRPAPTAWLEKLPITALTDRSVKPIRFRDWLARVASKYERHRNYEQKTGDKKADAGARAPTTTVAQVAAGARSPTPPAAAAASKAAAHKDAWLTAQVQRRRLEQPTHERRSALWCGVAALVGGLCSIGPHLLLCPQRVP